MAALSRPIVAALSPRFKSIWIVRAVGRVNRIGLDLELSPLDGVLIWLRVNTGFLSAIFPIPELPRGRTLILIPVEAKGMIIPAIKRNSTDGVTVGIGFGENNGVRATVLPILESHRRLPNLHISVNRIPRGLL